MEGSGTTSSLREDPIHTFVQIVAFTPISVCDSI